MKNTILLYIMVCILGCGNDTQYVFKPKYHKLTANTIYDKNMVFDMVFDSEELDTDSLRKKSRALFLRGIDLYKNRHKPVDAIASFKSSILIFPDAKTYYELGNALLETNKLKEAEDAFVVAERLDFQPISSLHIKKALIAYTTYLKDKQGNEYELYNAISELRNALKQGASPSLIAKERYLASITETNVYKNMLIDMQARLKQGDQVGLFTLFKNAFREQLPAFDLGTGDVEMKPYNQSISYEFARFIPEMENASFGRDVSHDFYYVGLVKETESYVALLYTSVSFFEEEMQPTRTMLAVYDQEGNLKEQKLVACQCSAEKIRRCSIRNNEVLVEDYLRVWEKPIDKVPFRENRITDHELLAKATFSINDQGNIVNKEVSEGYSDSMITASIK
jgi:tetratricopeptide (TPR) repeat protein